MPTATVRGDWDDALGNPAEAATWEGAVLEVLNLELPWLKLAKTDGPNADKLVEGDWKPPKPGETVTEV